MDTKSANLLLMIAAIWSVTAGAEKPNIVFIVADDLGWNDIGYTNPDIISPNLDSLAKSGIILDTYYVQPLCSPSRSAFMTGVYPYRMGLQHLVIWPDQDVCVPLNRTFLPQVLKSNGYTTHMLGKWHLGFCKWECTPTYRGFDTFYGFLNGGQDHYTKEAGDGYDFRDNTKVDREASKTYSTYLYADRMEKIVKDHNVSKPMFMYMAFQNVHMPMQVPDKYQNMYPNIKNLNRMYLSSMVTALDEAVGRLVDALKAKEIYNNTLIIFSADNGGWTTFGGNNYPLRGGKSTIFEGGTRAVGFVHGPMLNKTGGKYTGLMHAVDWFPTITEAAGVTYEDPDQDGMSQWSAINSKASPKRDTIIYNMDLSDQPVQGKQAIRVGDYKLIDGFPGLYLGWTKPDKVEESTQSKLPKEGNDTIFKFLFNLKDDPNEHVNLYYEQPQLAQKLEARLAQEQKRYVKPQWPPANPKSNPDLYGGVWTPGWC